MQIVGAALLIGCLILLIREHKPMFAMMLGLAAGIALFFLVLGELRSIFSVLREIARQANVQTAFVETLLKIIGIAFITEFASQTLRDAGVAGIAAKVELVGKVFILVLGLPILQLILETVLKLLD